MGTKSYLVQDLSLVCGGPAYDRASAFNVFFVVTVIAGWPLFLVWYLHKVLFAGRLFDMLVLVASRPNGAPSQDGVLEWRHHSMRMSVDE